MTGSINHCLTPQLARAIQESISGARLKPADRRNGYSYDIITVPASCMADPPTLILQFQQSGPTDESNGTLRRLEIPLCQSLVDAASPAPETDIATYCLRGQPPTARRANPVSVLGSVRNNYLCRRTVILIHCHSYFLRSI